METLSADLERYADLDEAVEQKIKQNYPIRMVISFCQEKEQRINEKNFTIYLNMTEWMKIVAKMIIII